MKTKTVTLWASILTVARGNYGYGQQYGSQTCDRNGYQRSMEMIRLELQRVQQQQRSGYDPNNNNNNNQRFPAMTNSYQGGYNQSYLGIDLNDHQCRMLRQSFDNLLINTPLCESIGSYQFQISADLIQQTRQLLMRACERNDGWHVAQCFKRREVIECENQFNYMKQNAQQRYNNNNNNDERGRFQSPPYVSNHQSQQQQQQLPVTFELCQTFEVFRNCVISQSRRECYTTDLEQLGTYFYDKSHNLAWSCIPATGSGGNSPLDQYSRRTDIITYSNPNRPGSGYYPQPPYGGNGQSPPILTSGSSYNQPSNGNQYPVVMDGSIDRTGGALAGLHAGTVSVCIERVRPFETQCLDHLIMRQREARYGRSSNDVQRRICCALFRYRDCLSRVVLERCLDNSRVTVDILMGDRNREITQTCRDVTRDQCNGTPAGINSSINLITILMVISGILIRYQSTSV